MENKLKQLLTSLLGKFKKKCDATYAKEKDVIEMNLNLESKILTISSKFTIALLTKNSIIKLTVYDTFADSDDIQYLQLILISPNYNVGDDDHTEYTYRYENSNYAISITDESKGSYYYRLVESTKDLINTKQDTLTENTDIQVKNLIAKDLELSFTGANGTKSTGKVKSNLTPSEANTYGLGNSSNFWKSVHVETAYLKNSLKISSIDKTIDTKVIDRGTYLTQNSTNTMSFTCNSIKLKDFYDLPIYAGNGDDKELLGGVIRRKATCDSNGIPRFGLLSSYMTFGDVGELTINGKTDIKCKVNASGGSKGYKVSFDARFDTPKLGYNNYIIAVRDSKGSEPIFAIDSQENIYVKGKKFESYFASDNLRKLGIKQSHINGDISSISRTPDGNIEILTHSKIVGLQYSRRHARMWNNKLQKSIDQTDIYKNRNNHWEQYPVRKWKKSRVRPITEGNSVLLTDIITLPLEYFKNLTITGFNITNNYLCIYGEIPYQFNTVRDTLFPKIPMNGICHLVSDYEETPVCDNDGAITYRVKSKIIGSFSYFMVSYPNNGGVKFGMTYIQDFLYEKGLNPKDE